MGNFKQSGRRYERLTETGAQPRRPSTAFAGRTDAVGVTNFTSLAEPRAQRLKLFLRKRWLAFALLLSLIFVLALLQYRRIIPDDDFNFASVPKGNASIAIPLAPFSTLNQLLASQGRISPVLTGMVGAASKSLPGGSFLELFRQTRVPGTKGHDQVKQELTRVLSELLDVADVQLIPFKDSTPQGTIEFTNIVATVNPAGSRKVVLAAHYDSKLFENFDFIGAIDSAVPCSMVLEIAEMVQNSVEIRESMQKMGYSLQFVFFDGEEAFEEWSETDSIYGARHLAKLWEAQGKLAQIEVLILLDLIGASSPVFFPLHESGGSFYRKLVQIEQYLYQTKSLLKSFFSPYFQPYRHPSIPENAIADDHVPFYRRGVPILHLVPLPFPSQWHQQSDSYKNLDKVAIENCLIILKLYIAFLFNVN